MSLEDAYATILIVDDSQTNLELVEAILQHAGYEVVSAKSAEHALEILESFTPQLIIADIMMPNMSGYDFYQALKEMDHLRYIPFVFLSAKGKRSDIHYGKELGADDYLTKPFSRQELLVTVKNKLTRAKEYGWNAEKQLERLKNEILRSLSHEFKTPLTVIKGSIDLLVQKSETNPNHDHLDDIRHSSERLEKLIDDFMLMVKAESGSLATEFQKKKYPIRLSEYLPYILDGYYKMAEESNVDFSLKIGEELPIIEVCEKHLNICLNKLIDNAFKFASNQNGYVEFSCFQRADKVILSIVNNGLEIPSKYYNKVFEKFFQVDRNKYEQQGAGIGLAITKFLVELNGGEIHVKSTNKKETCFEIHFPCELTNSQDFENSSSKDNSMFY